MAACGDARDSAVRHLPIIMDVLDGPAAVKAKSDWLIKSD